MKNRLPEYCHVVYDKKHPRINEFYETLERINPERIDPWKDFLPLKHSDGNSIYFHKNVYKHYPSHAGKELSIDEFIELSKPIEEKPWEPKYGEIVWAWDGNKSMKTLWVYLATITGAHKPFYVTNKDDFDITDFIEIPFKNISKWEPKEYTIEEVAKALNEEVGSFTIKNYSPCTPQTDQ